MAKQTAKACLLAVGDGGASTITASTLAVTVSSGVYKITDSASGLAGATVGSQVTVSGFTSNSWIGIVKASAAGELTIVSPVDPDTREAVIPVAEVAGAGHKATVEKFSVLKGQKSTSYDKSANEIDTTDKTSGNWGSSLAGTVKMSISVSGQIVFTADGKHGGWTDLSNAIDTAERLNYRLIINEAGDSYYGPFSISSQTGGGSDTDPNGYDFKLSNSGRPVYVAAA